MDPQELTNEVLLESILDCTHFVTHEVPNLFKSVNESLPHSDKIFFMNFVEDENGEDEYYGYIYDKTNAAIYEYYFQDSKSLKNRKLSLAKRDISKLTTKDILELPALHLL